MKKNNIISKAVYYFSCLHSSKNKIWTIKAQIHDVNSIQWHFKLQYLFNGSDIVNNPVQPTCSMSYLFPAAGEATNR